MALGFGFNKVKVLAQAEKFVQQGKLQNAIAEYEKVIKEDPKDLTVLNTIGDLNARVGNQEEATYYFKKVGDMYAQNGFTVKAIAIYKKLTKMGTYNAENTTKLAELYSQQGLFNDARTHYMQVADQLLKSGDNNQAARVFQKILELDPENAHTQAKLADLYQKLGKKDEARNIYYSAAESLYARGSYSAAEEALGRVLTIDPHNTGALMLRGLIAVEAGDSHAAVGYLEQVSDLDSRPDGLRALLRAKLHSGNTEGVDAVADKLLNAHNDLTGVNTVAQWYVTNNHVENALQVYEKYSERLFGGNPQALQDALYPLLNRVKENSPGMATLNRLMHKGGDHAQTAEMIEMQAHTAAQKGNFTEARDLYKKLTEMEPENALHSQNYKQMLSKLGEDSATRILTPSEAAQAFMVEELDETAPPVHQTYDPPTERAIESALTDAELYVSYNVPSKAIPPLEAALPLAPQDVNLNQRLATLYARAERYGDAARMYQNLSDIYKELGHPTESAKYLEVAKRYAMRAPAKPGIPVVPVSEPPRAKTAPPSEPVSMAHEAVVEVPLEPEVEAKPSVQEFSFDSAEVSVAEPEPPVVAPMEPVAPEPVVSEIVLEPIEVTPTPVTPPPQEAAPTAAHAEEIDISTEWEDMIEVEPEPAQAELHVQPAHEPVAEVPVAAIEPEPAPPAGPSAAEVAAQVSDKVQEIRFYITQEMWEPAKAAILDLTELSPDSPEVTELIAAVTAGQTKAAAPPAPIELEVQAPIMVEEIPVIQHEEAPVAFAPEEEIIEPVVAAPPPPPPPPAQAKKPKPEAPAAATPIKVEKEVVAPPPPPVAPPPIVAAPPPPVVQERKSKPAPEPAFVDQDDVLDILEEPKAKPPAAKPAAAAKAESTEDILSDFVVDLEQSELADFAPQPRTAASAAPSTPSVLSAPVTPAASAAPVIDRRVNGDMQDAESANVLSDILSELQEETAEAAEPEEDPETHYNLGIAFKEMGLLDEAIGELQKVCHAVDRGAEFSQPIQALTWLAQCLVDKGAPEAAVRWYQKALQLPGLDAGSRCSIYYDLATAYESSGDKKSALTNYMEVYGSNIDFRDVASRIKALKS